MKVFFTVQDGHTVGIAWTAPRICPFRLKLPRCSKIEADIFRQAIRIHYSKYDKAARRPFSSFCKNCYRVVKREACSSWSRAQLRTRLPSPTGTTSGRISVTFTRTESLATMSFVKRTRARFCSQLPAVEPCGSHDLPLLASRNANRM